MNSNQPANDEQKQIEFTVKSLAREEIIEFIDILIRVLEKGELKDPIEILHGVRNAVVKRDLQPLMERSEEIFGKLSEGGSKEGGSA